jgi:NAD(P)-dependent dehydrogenase (short-subunit alcohol dehydrogenase family)
MTQSKKAAPVALITGASTGVGLHTAIRFAEAGYRTIATMRNTAKKGELLAQAKAAGVKVTIRQLDVAKPASIRRAIAGAIASFGGVDVLVNNAGAGFLASVEQTSEADLRNVMEVNFFGVWNATKAVLPHMRERGSGRIITVTSVGGLIGQPFNEAYCAAKFAVEGMMEGLAPLARRLGVHVSLVEPGPINTAFVDNVRAASSKILPDLAPPYDRLVAAYMGASGDVFATHGQTGDDIARIILDIARAEKPDFRNITSDFARMVVAPKVVDPTGNSVVDAFAARLGG